MVTNIPNSDEQVVTFKARIRPKVKGAMSLRQRVIDLKRIMVESIKGEELHQICRDAIELALAGNKEAREWVVQQIVGTPIKSPELETCEEGVHAEPPKVVLLDWRRNGLDAPAESN